MNEESRQRLRQAALRPAPAVSSELDASLKRNTAYLKRLKGSLHTSEAADLLVKETRTLSLEKYSSELVAAAAEGVQRCKTTQEVLNACEAIVALHLRFPDSFTQPFIAVLLASLKLPAKSSLAQGDQREKDETARVLRQRGLLRILGELDAIGLCSNPVGTATLGVLKELVGSRL
jgi:regulator of nonsense transcripts 2